MRKIVKIEIPTDRLSRQTVLTVALSFESRLVGWCYSSRRHFSESSSVAESARKRNLGRFENLANSDDKKKVGEMLSLYAP